MKSIRILVPRAGVAVTWNAGTVLAVGTEIDAAEAARLVNAGDAELVAASHNQTETAAIAGGDEVAAERASGRRGRGRRKVEDAR